MPPGHLGGRRASRRSRRWRRTDSVRGPSVLGGGGVGGGGLRSAEPWSSAPGASHGSGRVVGRRRSGGTVVVVGRRTPAVGRRATPAVADGRCRGPDADLRDRRRNRRGRGRGGWSTSRGGRVVVRARSCVGALASGDGPPSHGAVADGRRRRFGLHERRERDGAKGGSDREGTSAGRIHGQEVARSRVDTERAVIIGTRRHRRSRTPQARQSGLVIAPVSAPCTSRAYLPSTPVV